MRERHYGPAFRSSNRTWRLAPARSRSSCSSVPLRRTPSRSSLLSTAHDTRHDPGTVPREEDPKAKGALQVRRLDPLRCGCSPRRFEEVHVGGQRLLDHLLECLLLGYGLLHPLLGHLLEGLLLFLRQLHPLLGGLMEGLPRSPLPLFLRLLGDVEGWGVEELDVAAHLFLHHLLEGLLLPLDLIRHRLHRGDPSPSDLFCRLLAPAHVVAHFLFPPGRPCTSQTTYSRRGNLETMGHRSCLCERRVVSTISLRWRSEAATIVDRKYSPEIGCARKGTGTTTFLRSSLARCKPEPTTDKARQQAERPRESGPGRIRTCDTRPRKPSKLVCRSKESLFLCGFRATYSTR